MSMYSFPTLGRISRERLASLLLSHTLAPNVAVIDVRDSDHVGGHINGSTHVPSSSLDYRTPELVRKMADKQIVVFHCALSQQRGPSAALRYLRERESKGLNEDHGAKEVGVVSQLSKEESVAKQNDGSTEGEKPKKKGDAISDDSESHSEQLKKAEQEVYVLDGGFVKWQEM